jgi:OOP family OmpA-OmpF porin
MKKLLAAVAISLLSATAMAQDKGWYVGGAFGQSKAKDFCTGVSGPGVTCDDSDVTLKGMGGYQFTRNVAVEFGLTAAGAVEARGPAGTVTIDAAILDAAAVGILPLGDKFSVFGKVGLYTSAVETDFNTLTVRGTERTTNSDLTYGAGVGFAITPKLVVRAEWQRYQDVDAGPNVGKSDVDVIGLGMVYRFF